MAAIDYDRWAERYDETRGASPSVLGPILQALGPSRGRFVLDIGGGTGNFAAPLLEAGFRVILVDLSRKMVRRAEHKLPNAELLAVSDAQRLPLRDRTIDCAISVNVLGHLPNWKLALKEARRVLRGGPLVLKVSTRETVTANWVMQYFPALLDHAPLHHYQPAAVTVEALSKAGFSSVEQRPVHYTDIVDGSFQALKHRPELFFDDRRVMNTAALMRVPEPERSRAVAQIRSDYRSGRLREIVERFKPLTEAFGDGFVFEAYP